MPFLYSQFKFTLERFTGGLTHGWSAQRDWAFLISDSTHSNLRNLPFFHTVRCCLSELRPGGVQMITSPELYYSITRCILCTNISCVNIILQHYRLEVQNQQQKRNKNLHRYKLCLLKAGTLANFPRSNFEVAQRPDVIQRRRQRMSPWTIHPAACAIRHGRCCANGTTNNKASKKTRFLCLSRVRAAAVKKQALSGPRVGAMLLEQPYARQLSTRQWTWVYR
ncbi:hypothetical protein T01_13250 [Trichinella spiralis]|uniref:Uncharacterized protein n=1 Tax=Trichinella spiralis TaxID=6334 RepID=A0A0V1BE02_TRISP|nr:hypothetical protein T01_13250 [Trichinella spiralis]